MLVETIGFLVAYLALGLLTCRLARRGWPDEWDEALLASVLAPPFMALVATAYAADVVRARVQVMLGIFFNRATAGR